MKMEEKVAIAKSRIIEEFNKIVPDHDHIFTSEQSAKRIGLTIALTIINQECR